MTNKVDDLPNGKIDSNEISAIGQFFIAVNALNGEPDYVLADTFAHTSEAFANATTGVDISSNAHKSVQAISTQHHIFATILRMYYVKTIVNRHIFILSTIISFVILLGACSSAHRIDGWYPVADSPENRIEGKAIVTTKDFATVSLDTVTSPDIAIIEGKLKADKVQTWADATESRIGKRIGFVFNNSVITAPTVNCRIESGGFSINSPDKALILKIYNSIINQK